MAPSARASSAAPQTSPPQPTPQPTLVVNRANAEHYRWGNDCCDGWYRQKSDALTVIEERMPPASHETLHRHAHSRQVFFVLEGEAVIEMDGRRVRLARNDSITVAPGTAHRVRNDSRSDLTLLVISQPNSHNDRQDLE